MPLEFLDDAVETPATSPPIPSTLPDDSKLEWLDDTPKTRKLAGLHEERRRLRRPTKTVFDAAEEFEPIQLVPFVASKPEIDKATDIYIAAKNVEANTDTEADRRLLNDFNEDRKRDTDLGYKVASIVTQLPAFAGELMATGGIYSAGRVAAQKMALKAVDGLLKKASEKALVKVGSKVAGVTGGAALQAGPAGALRAVETATERATPEISTSLDSTGTTIQATRTKAGETLTEAIPLAAVDSFIEVFSEHTGGGIGQVLKGAGRIASKVVPIPQKVQAFTRAAREWFRINPNSTIGEMMVKLRDRAYWNGWAAEIGEERVADILRPLLGVEEEFRLPSGEQLAAEAIAFAIPGAAARGVQTASELTLGATGYRQRQQDAAEQAEFERRSRLVADIVARQEADPRTRAPRETVPPSGAITPEAQRVIEARQAADRGMLPPSPIPFEQPMVSPEMGITAQPLPVPPELPAPERVNRENLVAIGSDVLNRYQSIPDLPPRAQALLPTIRRLLQRAGEDPTPVTLQNLASLLGLEYDENVPQMPRQYSYVEGGRLSRPPRPAAPVPRGTTATEERPADAQAIRTDTGQLPPAGPIPEGIQAPRRDDLEQAPPVQTQPVAPQEAPPISPVTPLAGTPRRRAPSQRTTRAKPPEPEPSAPVPETSATPAATVPAISEPSISAIPELQGFQFKPVRWQSGLPVFVGKTARKELTRRFGIPTGLATTVHPKSGLPNPFAASNLELFVDDDQDGKPIAVYDPSIDVEAVTVPVAPEVTAPPTPVAPSEALNIGDPIRIMGVDSVLAKSETIDGVRYDLFNGAALKEKRAAVRVTDVDTGTVVTLQQHPTYDSAEATFNETVQAAKKTTATPVAPAVAQAPTPPASETEVTTPEELKADTVKEPATKQQEIQFDASTARKSKGEAVSSPVSESDATRAVLQTLGGTSMPSNITFTNDPDAPKGQVTFAAGQLPQIEINLAKHDSPDSVKDTLIHELLHPVQEDAGMAGAVDAVANLVSDTDRARKAALGYNADETQVEATNELIRQFYAEHANSNIFQRAVTSVIIAAKRLFGIDLTARQAAVVLVRDAVKNHVAATSGEGMSREQFASRPALRQFTSRPGIDAAQRAQLERVAQAQAALVPDEIAEAIESLSPPLPDESISSQSPVKPLSPPSPVEARVHSLLKFLIDLRTLATPEQLANLLRGQDPQEVKDLAVAMVLTQVEHVRMKQKEFGNFLLAATREMKALAPQVAKLGTLNLKNEFARGMAKALIDGYQRYMSAAAATLPADANVAAAQKSVLATMAARLDDWKQTPEAIIRAIQVIGSNASQFPSDASATAIADIVRTSGMLSGQVSQEVIDLLTAPKEGGLPSLLEASTDFVENMAILRTLDARKADYARQLEAFESLFEFATEKPSSPVQLRQFANAYRKWRNDQTDTQKIIRTIKADAKRLDEDISVYEMAGSILDQLQNHPDFRNAFEAALESSNALMKDFASTDPLTGNKIYAGPMSGTEYIIPMRPDRVADETALDQMGRLLEEVDEFLQQPDADPILLRSWKLRSDYIRTFQYFPQFGTIFQTKMNVGGVRVSLNPFEWPRQLFFNRHRTIRTELEMMDFRAATDVMREVQLADGISREFSILRNHPEFGYAAITNSVLAAVKSHGLATDQIELWNLLIAEPIIASHQTLGMVQLKSGQLINGYKVTPEDIAAVETMKRFSNRSLQITQKADAGQLFRKLKLFNPLQIKTKFAGLSILRNAFGTGTMTMARVPSAWGEDFAKVWLEKPNRQARLEMIADGYGFRLAVMGYARESNPEFNRESQFEKYFQRLADVARTDPALNFSSLDAFVDWLAQETVQDELYPDTITAKTEIRTQLLREITAFVENYRSGSLRWEEDFEKEDGIPEPLMRMVTAKNSFTKPRIGLSAPSTFFSYSLAEDIRRTSYLASAYTVFQLRQLVAMKNLLRALESKRSEYEVQIKKMGFESGTKSAERAVQKQSHEEMAREGQTRFDYDTLTEKINLLNKIFNDFEALISDKPEAFDSILLYFLSQQTNLLSSLLLSSPQAIMNNTASGMLATPFIIEQNLGRASFLFLPRAAKAISGAMVNAVMAGFSKNKAVMRVLRSNLPVFRSLANDLADYMLEQQQKYGMAKEYGLINPADVTGRLQAQRQLRTTGGRIDFGRTGALISAANWVESFPGVRWALEQVKDKSPRLFDDIINRIVNEMQRGGVLTDYKQHAIRIFSGREERQQPLEAQILARELGLKFESDLDKTRMVFSAVGSFDAILLDYYRRWKAAPEADRHAVPLFTDPADETTVVFEFALRGNLTSPSNIPYAIQGVGYKGAVKRIVWMFWGMPIRIGEQIEKLSVRSSKDPRGAGLVHAVLQPILTLVFMALAGMGAWEIGQLLRELYAGRRSAQLRLANVAADPDTESIMRYTGIGLVYNLPYYGELISRFLGNPGYRGFMDVTEIIPAAGLVKDAAQSAIRIWQTGDAVYPLSDFMARWAPPLQPLQRLTPGLAGDIMAKNAARALSSVAPRDMELARERGGGGFYRQTPTTPEIRDLISAAYRNDSSGVLRAYERAVAARQEQGSEDPEGSVWQTITSKVPSRQVFGRLITEDEEARLLKRMSGGQRADYLASRDAFALIAQTLGKAAPRAIKDERRPVAQARTGQRIRGYATTRALLGSRRRPSFPRRRSLARRRRASMIPVRRRRTRRRQRLSFA